jgi:hypothetical protein
MYKIGDRVIYQGADKDAYKRVGTLKSIEEKDGKPQLTVEFDGGETFTAPVDDWSREFTNACKNGCTSTNSVVRNAMTANRSVASNWKRSDAAAKVSHAVDLLVGLYTSSDRMLDIDGPEKQALSTISDCIGRLKKVIAVFQRERS